MTDPVVNEEGHQGPPWFSVEELVAALEVRATAVDAVVANLNTQINSLNVTIADILTSIEHRCKPKPPHPPHP